MSAKPPLLLYVNIPFCNSKCHFCDWVAHVPIGDLRLGPESQKRRGHLAALRTQIEHQAPDLGARYRPEVMYWGGGTASILSHPEIESLYGALAGAFAMDGIGEATIESSPESLTLEKLRLFRGLGFNRISIGVQSFDDARLRMIGRAHSAEGAEHSVRLAQEAGFDNINIDLIVGFPDQDLAEVESMIRRALTLPVNHFSIYAYRASQGTVMRRRLDREKRKTDLRNQLAAYRLAGDILVGQGFDEYQFAYFGSPVCVADLSYYQLSLDWAGFGSGAFSVLDGRMKGFVAGKLDRYIDDPTTFDYDLPVSHEQAALNLISFALTTNVGALATNFEQRAGVALAEALEYPAVREYLDQLREHAPLISDADGVRFAPQDIATVFISMNWVDPPNDPKLVESDVAVPA